jgi:hypothetical protein
MPELPIVRLDPDLPPPAYARAGDAGADLVAEPAHEQRHLPAHPRLLVGRPVHQEAVDLRLRLDRAQVGVDRGGGPIASRARSGQGVADAREQQLDVALGQRAVEAPLVAEVPVEDRLGDAGLRGDRVHRRFGAVAHDHALRRGEQLLAPDGRPTCPRRGRDLRHGHHHQS